MRITLLRLDYEHSDPNCISIYSSSILFSRNTNPRYLTVFPNVNGSVPMKTVGQHNFKRQGLCTMHTDFTVCNIKSFAML